METLSRKQILLASKEELVDIVLKLQEENERLRKENEKLREQLHRPAKDSHNSNTGLQLYQSPLTGYPPGFVFSGTHAGAFSYYGIGTDPTTMGTLLVEDFTVTVP